MGWKIYTIFISDPGNVEINETFVSSLGLTGFQYVGEEEFNFGPKRGDLFIGKYNDHLLISNADLNFQFFKSEATKVEKLFIERFRNSEMAVLTSGNIYAYNIISKGVKVRVMEGGDEVYQNAGELLPEEIMLSNARLIPEEDLKFMREDLTEEEIAKEIAAVISGETVFELTKRYLGMRIDSAAMEYHKIRGVRFENKEAKTISKYPELEKAQFVH